MKTLLWFALLFLVVGCSTNKYQVIKVVHYADNGDTIAVYDSCMYLSTDESGIVDFYSQDGTYTVLHDHYSVFYKQVKK